MSKENYVEFEGEVLQIYPAGKFQVELKLENDETRNIVAHISGKMRMNKINILAGDQVEFEGEVLQIYPAGKFQATRLQWK